MFDRRALRTACGIYNLQEVDCLWLDTAQVVGRAWAQFRQRGYTLDNIANYLGIECLHHNALEDARAAAVVLLQAVEDTGLIVRQWPDGQTPDEM